jgi:hypothetical protein
MNLVLRVTATAMFAAVFFEIAIPTLVLGILATAFIEGKKK